MNTRGAPKRSFAGGAPLVFLALTCLAAGCARNVTEDDCKAVGGHLHELWWVGNNPVQHWDLSAVAGAPPAASDPAAYVSPRTRTKHVLYRGTDGHVHAISWVPGAGDPAHTDLTLAAAAPPAADTPRGFAGPNGEHVVYRGTDGQIHEIRWSEI